MRRRKSILGRNPRQIVARASGIQRGSCGKAKPHDVRSTADEGTYCSVTRKPNVTIEENTPLVSSGLIDSMALVDLLLKLEDRTHMRIPAGKIQPKDLDAVAKMFSTAQRVGKPLK
jgi:acyl carrier protein